MLQNIFYNDILKNINMLNEEGIILRYNILDFGGVSDGVTDNTLAFERAVSACFKDGGGYVTVPAGKYVTGTVELKSNVYLELLPGAELLGSMDFSKYKPTKRGCAWGARAAMLVNDKMSPDASNVNPCKALVMAEDAHHVGIIGQGILDGRRDNSCANNPDVGMPYLVVFSHCEDVLLRDVTMYRPGSFTNYLLGCKRVTISGLHINSVGTACGDGIDFDGGEDVTISDCIIDAGDDGIGLKCLTPSEPCVRFTITNCTIRSELWGCIRIGPESTSHFKNITVSNCVFYDSNDGIKLQLCEEYNFEDFTFTGITMNNVTRPFFITVSHYPFSIYSSSSRPDCGHLRRMNFSNITALLTERRNVNLYTPYSGCFLYSLPKFPMEDISFDNIRLTCLGGGTKEMANKTDQHDILDYVGLYPESCLSFKEPPAAAFTIRNAKNIRFSHVDISCIDSDERCAFAVEEVDGLTLHGVSVKNAGGLLRKHNCENLSVEYSRGEIVEFTPEQKEKYNIARKEGRDMDEKIRSITSIIDSVNGEYVEFLGSEGLEIPANTKGKVVIPLVDGCFALCLDNEKIAEYVVPKDYRTKTAFACIMPKREEDTTLRFIPLEDCTMQNPKILFYKG